MTTPKNKLFFLLIVCFNMIGLTSCKQEKKEDKKAEEIEVDVKNEETVIPDTLKWSERMALTLMKAHPEAYQIDDKEEPKWDYVHGLVLTGFEKLYEKTGKEEYFEYIKGYADTTIDSLGEIPSYKFENYNIDMINAGKILFGLYHKTKDEKYLKAMQLLKKQLDEHPRTKSGGFWHKKIYPYQMWLDGLYMGAPFYTRYTTEFENGKDLSDVAKQFELIQKYAKDEETGLLYHG